jgi:hypothetical protein
MAAATTGKTFDQDLFCKLVLLMDSPNEFERQRATTQALQMCVARSVRFCDMVAHGFGQGTKRVAELEAELEDARRGGDDLADELRRCEQTIAEYRKAERARSRFCRPCENKRRVIAVLYGGAIIAGWYFRFELRAWRRTEQSYGVVLALAPLVFLVCRWAVIQFKRRNHWMTWRDNDVFRAAGSWWNRFLEKFVIDVKE